MNTETKKPIDLSRKRRGRRAVEPLFRGPIPDNPEYRELVTAILKDKRRRDLIESYRNQKTIAHIREAKQKLVTELNQCIKAFQEETGVMVTSIDIATHTSFSAERLSFSVITSVEVERI